MGSLSSLACEYSIVIKAGDGGPGAISSGLSGLGVERFGKSILLSQFGAIALEVITIDPTSLHPEAQACVAHTLRRSDGLLDGALLGIGPV